MQPTPNIMNFRKAHDSGNYDASLFNHMSQKELSPHNSISGEFNNNTLSNIKVPGQQSPSQKLNHSLSPSRFNSTRINFNSEISDSNNLKKLSLHTYHIKNKNGSPTAQVTILKDSDDPTAFIDEPLDTASVSQSTTKVSGPPH